MSGSADKELRAAEYVLGTATAREAAAMPAAMRVDPELADAVAAWERELAPLSGLAPPEAPPPGLWERIEAAVAPAASVPAGRQRGWRNWKVRLLGTWAGGATAAALAMGALLLLAEPEPRPLMTVMVADRTQGAWSAQVQRDGAIRLTAIAPAFGDVDRPTPPDRVMQLWALPPGATAPTSLALLPRDRRGVTVPAPAVRPQAGMLIEITLEPQGGSPTGRPTGPVLFIGRLSQPGPDS